MNNYNTNTNTNYTTSLQGASTYYNPNLPMDSRTIAVPPQQTPPALIQQPPAKPPQTVYERTVGMRIRYAVLAGILFLLFSLPITYRISNQVWSIFSSVPLFGKSTIVPTMVQHPNGYQVQQMVEKPCGIGLKAMIVHAAAVAAVMYILLSRKA